MANTRKYKCPYCEEKYMRPDLIKHVERKHKQLIPEGYTPARVVYNSINHCECGKCRVCGKPTEWNEKIGRYNVLCGDPKCKEELRKRYQDNMIRVHGTDNILNDEEQQKKMLANRSISGTYRFHDGGVLKYTGSYEKACLEFMDVVMGIPSADLLSPGPTLEYEFEGTTHMYITDFYYIPYNLIIEVKDGGDNVNHKDSESMRKSREKTIQKEKLITDKGEFNYIRLTNNNFAQLLEVFMDIKKKLLEGDTSKTYHINENAIIGSYFTEAEYQDDYMLDEVKEVFNQLSKEEQIDMGSGWWLKAGYIHTMFRKVAMKGDKAVGFIDIYKEPKFRKSGLVMIGVVPEARRSGIARQLVNTAISHFKSSKDIEKLVWRVDTHNKASIGLAESSGFKYKEEYRENGDYCFIYEYPISKTLKEDAKYVDDNGNSTYVLDSFSRIRLSGEVGFRYAFRYSFLNGYLSTSTSIGYIWTDSKDNIVACIDTDMKAYGRRVITTKYIAKGYESLNDQLNKFAKDILMCVIEEAGVQDPTYAIKDIKTPEQVFNFVKNNITYKHTDEFHTPAEVLKNGWGDCHDQAYLVEQLLKQRCKVKTQRWFFIENEKSTYNGGQTHTACFYLDEHGKWRWIETAWDGEQKIHDGYDSVEDCIENEVMKAWNLKPNFEIHFNRTTAKPPMSFGDYVAKSQK